jgi:hypothetical protein
MEWVPALSGCFFIDLTILAGGLYSGKRKQVEKKG